MNERDFTNVYFLGIGGIGMSALARYFMHEGKAVAGYDRTPSHLTAELESEGAEVTFDEQVESIPAAFRDKSRTIVVYTPAVPSDHAQMRWFREEGFEVVKRSQMLGYLSEGKYVMAVAGTHGKTSTSTLAAWINHTVTGQGSAFLGGISKNFDSNLVLGTGRRLVVEADEFDRSFLRLHPDVAVITATDPDHLDIYGTHEAMKEAFAQFASQIKPHGYLILKQGLVLPFDTSERRLYRYSFDSPCDFYTKNIALQQGGHYLFDLVCPDGVIEGCRVGVPGWINVENAVAATAAAWCAAQSEGARFDHEAVRRALDSFSGVKRRFEFYVNTPKAVYMDDYAHHPRELAATLSSMRKMFPERKITALFQPHLYTRTRDFYEEFAESLSLADEVVLLPIYPAREEPIEGISSEIIAQRVVVPCRIVPRDEAAQAVRQMSTDVVVSFGAGNIDAICEELASVISNKSKR